MRKVSWTTAERSSVGAIRSIPFMVQTYGATRHVRSPPPRCLGIGHPHPDTPRCRPGAQSRDSGDWPATRRQTPLSNFQSFWFPSSSYPSPYLLLIIERLSDYAPPIARSPYSFPDIVCSIHRTQLDGPESCTVGPFSQPSKDDPESHRTGH